MTPSIKNEKIVLTDEEVRSVLSEHHRTGIRYQYEDAVSECESEGWISFESWSSTEIGAEYSSEADARNDFIEKLTDDYLESEELYERDPEHFRSYPDYTEDVLELAEDFGYRTKEE